MIYSNHAHEQNTGLDRAAIAGRYIDDIFSQGSAAMCRRNYEAALAKQTPFRYREILRMTDGEHWYETTLNVIPSQADMPTRIVGTSKDITQTQSLALSEKVARSEFEQFIGLAAHDLRTPMRNVGQIAEMLRDGFTDLGDGKTEMIDLLDDLGVQACDLIERILTFVEAGNLAAPVETVSLDILAQQLVAVMDTDGNHRLEAPPALIATDPLVLQIILRILIDNTLKHGGGPDLQIRIEAHQAAQNNVELRYSDTGRGFDGLNVFNDAKNCDNRQSGYGLATVARMLATRGGSIATMPSHFGVGAGLVLHLPGKVLPAKHT